MTSQNQGRRCAIPGAVEGIRTAAISAIAKPFEGSGGLEKKAFGSYSNGSGTSLLTQLRLTMGGTETLQYPYVQHPWINACIRAIARAAAKVPLRFRKGPNPDDEELEEGHPIYRLFARPNPLASARKWQALTATLQMLNGEHFDFLLKGGKEVEANRDGTIPLPEELWTVRGDAVRHEVDPRTSLLVAWKFTTPGGEVVFRPTGVWHPYDVDPHNPYRGLGPAEVAFRTASKDYTLDRFDEALLKNGGQPSGYIETDHALPIEDREEIKRSYESNVGGASNHRRPMVLSHGTKFVPQGHTPEQMDLPDLREWNRDVIMSLFGVTKPILGITDDVNRANAVEARRVFWEDTMIPYLEYFADDLSAHFLSRLERSSGMQNGDDQLWAFFDTSNVDVLRGTESSRVDTALSLFTQGGRSLEEAAEITGLDIPPGLPGAAERYLPAGLVPADLAGEVARQQARPSAAQESGEKAATAIPVTLERVIESDALTDKEREWAKTFDRSRRIEYAAGFEKALTEHDKRASRVAASVLRKWMGDTKARIRAFAEGKAKDLANDPETYDEWADLETKRSQADIERQLANLIGATSSEWEALLADAMKPPLDRAWDSAARDMAKETGAVRFVRHEQPEARKFLESKRIKLAEESLGTLQEDVRKTILDAMREEGVNHGTLASRLRETLEKWSGQLDQRAGSIPVRAERIARTEITGVSNAARMEEMRKDGVTKSMWVSSQDAITRPHHMSLDGVIRNLGKQFGYGLRFPGDPSAAVGEIVNCRCTITPVPPE